MADGPLTDGEREEIASALWCWFLEFTDAGFSDEQATRLCASMIGDVL